MTNFDRIKAMNTEEMTTAILNEISYNSAKTTTIAVIAYTVTFILKG